MALNRPGDSLDSYDQDFYRNDHRDWNARAKAPSALRREVEARENLKEAVQLILAANREQSQQFASGKETIREDLTIEAPALLGPKTGAHPGSEAVSMAKC